MGLTRIRAEQISDIDYKQAVRVVQTTNVTLAGGAPSSVDSVNLVTNDRVLVTGQNTASQNGLYLVQTVGAGSNGTWIRTSDANATGEIEAGMIVMVTEGNNYADTQWLLTTNNPITIGTTNLSFVINSTSVVGGANTEIQYNSGGTLAGSANLTWDNTKVAVVGAITATGNISGNYFIGNGSLLTGITGGGGGSSISNGTSNVVVVSSGGNVTVGVGGTNNVAVFGSTQTTLAGNLLTGGLVSATGNVTGGNFITSGIANAASFTGATVSVSGNISAANVDAGGLVSVVGNVIAGNVSTAGVITATGNVTGSYFIGNGSQLTGISADSTQILSGTSNVKIVSSGGNATVNIGGSSNIAVFSTSGLDITGRITATGNVDAGNLRTAGLVSATGTITGANITGSNFITAGLITATGNVDAGNLRTAGLISATGNITGGNVLGGANVNATTHTGTTVSVTGNVDAGNLRTAGLITATGTVTSAANITGGNLTTAGLITATGNVDAGNLRTAGLITATGNITGGNLITGGVVSATSTVSDSIGDVREIVQNSQSGATYTLVVTDLGKHINFTGSTAVAVPNTVFAAGDAVTIYNNQAANITVVQNNNVTLRLAGSATTGNRTMLQYGLATVLCVAANTFVISGAGLL